MYAEAARGSVVQILIAAAVANSAIGVAVLSNNKEGIVDLDELTLEKVEAVLAEDSATLRDLLHRDVDILSTDADLAAFAGLSATTLPPSSKDGSWQEEIAEWIKKIGSVKLILISTALFLICTFCLCRNCFFVSHSSESEIGSQDDLHEVWVRGNVKQLDRRKSWLGR
mmetsp:Transcript_7684/g.14354  ORF Transcript_7684/g.14354 Transcript_7684/m.14354 type:complete len:169 (+) Transcript_7684:75-581(+)|eukprot:CAMPEP_0172855596 /NCGR_PEP_ID=MMETSP1075-20121228/61988_1 /TAXON_ID=2916 /ORGANISM="Ceratium fusus, Strain PA161109" /LENGTH=168 /DNA_ID=CAMNT_0013702583 /DNA_START=75 /DNA_END=581 /DNA_ORIENTATION=+